MIALELHSPQPPSVVLNSLQAHAGEWRQSHIPDELRRAGVGAVESRIQGSTCTLSFRRRWYGPVERSVSLSAEVTVYPDETGTRVLLDIAYHHRVSPWLFTLLIGVVTAIGLALFGILGLWFLFVGAASLALQYSLVRSYNRDLTRARPLAAEYLLSRVKSAVAMAGQPSGSRMASE
jgi:hypothetical protein